MVITDISLVGWFVSSYETTSIGPLVLALGTIVAVSIGIRFLHRSIKRKIASLREL